MSLAGMSGRGDLPIALWLYDISPQRLAVLPSLILQSRSNFLFATFLLFSFIDSKPSSSCETCRYDACATMIPKWYGGDDGGLEGERMQRDERGTRDQLMV